ncbi:MAG: 50S ribosomal protein L11 methyltransferase, partial [Fusobacterium periodonticum]|nr:50S ribosomal protein L11 methyltransferase [Fusobacterium periodonticum]
MKVLEAKVIYESDNIEKYKKIISDIFYDFGVTGLK